MVLQFINFIPVETFRDSHYAKMLKHMHQIISKGKRSYVYKRIILKNVLFQINIAKLQNVLQAFDVQERASLYTVNDITKISQFFSLQKNMINQQNFYDIMNYKIYSTCLLQVDFTLKETRKLDEIYKALEKQDKKYINVMQINKQIKLCFTLQNPFRYVFVDINEEKQNSYCVTLLIHAFDLQELHSYQFNDPEVFSRFLSEINSAVSDNQRNANAVNLGAEIPQLLQVNFRVELRQEVVFKPCTANPFQTCKCDIGTECFRENHDDGTELLSITYKKSAHKSMLIHQVQAYGLSKQMLQDFRYQFNIDMFIKFLTVSLLPFVRNIETQQPLIKQQQPIYQQFPDYYNIKQEYMNDFKY